MTFGNWAWLLNLALCALAGALAALFLSQSVLRPFEDRSADIRLSQQKHDTPQRTDIVVIGIDDETTQDLPFQSPVNRELLARIIERLDQLGARAIALDVILDRPSFPDHDQRLAAAIASARASIILGRDPGRTLAAAACGEAAAAPADRPRTDEASTILPAFAGKATLGSLVLCLDADGVIRRLAVEAGDTPTFAAAIAGALGKPVRADGRAIPVGLTAAGALPVPIYSAARLDILPEDWIRDRAVLIGAATPYSHDWFATPLRFAGVELPIEPAALIPPGEIPGVVIHALQAGALVDNAHGKSIDWVLGGVLALFGAVAGAALGAAPGWWWLRTAAALGAAGLSVVFAVYALLAGVLLPVTTFPLALAMGGGLAAAAQSATLRRQRRMIRRAFERYLAPDVVEQLVRDPSLVARSATQREITVLFTDLEGFTRFVDTNPPDIVTEIINDYLDLLVGVVQAHQGAIDKIVGDAVHAFFSAPIADPNHRAHACACALAIDAASEAYREQVKQKFGVALGVTRIGVHSGEAMVGNFGGEGRLAYTAHGSTINAAARLEAANKIFGTRICISEAARAPVDGGVWRTIADVRLRGIARPLTVYELSPAAGAADAAAYEDAHARILTSPEEARLLLASLARPGDALTAWQIARTAATPVSPVVDL